VLPNENMTIEAGPKICLDCGRCMEKIIEFENMCASLEDKIFKYLRDRASIFRFYDSQKEIDREVAKETAEIARKHFKKNQEEFGLVRIDEVLKIFDSEVINTNGIYPDHLKIKLLRKAIEGMKKDLRMEKSIADGRARHE
jgi:hypothetical protein